MSLKTIATRTQLAQKVPLRLVLVVPFVLQIFAAVGLVGYFSLRNGQKAIKVDEMVIPPSQELTNVYQAAKGGYVLRIIEEANRIQQLDSKYTA
jgi:hypothetical protein